MFRPTNVQLERLFSFSSSPENNWEWEWRRSVRPIMPSSTIVLIIKWKGLAFWSRSMLRRRIWSLSSTRLSNTEGNCVNNDGKLKTNRKIINAAALNVNLWNIQLLKLKSIFHTLNMFSVDVTHKCLIAECWIPTDDIPLVKEALRKGVVRWRWSSGDKEPFQEQSGSHVHAVLNEMHTHRTPPTHFRTNKFTQGFQNIVDAYGIATYREVNPG